MWRWLSIGLVALGLGASSALGIRELSAELARPRSLHETAYVGSGECTRCHPDHAASFRRTYHRTMTQLASEQSVLGAFDAGAGLSYGGIRAHMTRDEAGSFWMTFSAGAQRWRARVERTVGSHHYQQYLAREGDVFFRLPIAWDVADRRFIHMNGAFLTPDPLRPADSAFIARDDYDRHVTRWNDNCVFCHNVGPNPGLSPETGEFTTQVAELGVACEACHGPAAEHVEHNRNPLRRYVLAVGDVADPSIRNPARMSPARSAEVCGRCHGQRITDDVGRFLRDGDRFVPGDPLSEQSRPLFRDTTLRGEAGVFAPRFWSDGTPRLTAYEYQGYLQSACAREGELTCESCHAMHAGDPSGQLRPDRRGDAACTSCHRELAGRDALAAHSRHDPAGEGARCTGCHMPDIVYGLVSVRLSHRIELPDPAAQARAGRPDACTLCHVDRDRAWAIEQAGALFGSRAPTSPLHGAADLAEVTRLLFAGDPIERSVAAHALGKQSACAAQAHDGPAIALLLDIMLEDAYPAVRRIAQRSLVARLSRQRPELVRLAAAYVATDDTPARVRSLAELRAALGPDVRYEQPEEPLRAALRGLASDVAIEIGE